MKQYSHTLFYTHFQDQEDEKAGWVYATANALVTAKEILPKIAKEEKRYSQHEADYTYETCFIEARVSSVDKGQFFGLKINYERNLDMKTLVKKLGLSLI